MEVDLLIHSAAQLVTCAAGDRPKRGTEMADVGLIEDGAVAISDGEFVDAGPSAVIRPRYAARCSIDASGKAVCPGLIDAHTHIIYGGDRAGEFELRIKGATYMEIMAAGGGIVSTVARTREATVDQLVDQARARLDEMWSLGSTTVEIKSGYGLDTTTELKMLESIGRLDQTHPCDIVPTFLGAHTAPPEYRGDPEGYTGLVIEEMLPAAVEWYRASHFAERGVPFFIDVFCEDHAFDVDQSRRILRAGLDAGLRAKIHVDQFNSLGGLSMALELGATSVDHLDVTGGEDIERLANSESVAALLPAVNFNLGMSHYADGRSMIDRGAAVTLATDFNPGSAPGPSMPMVMAIACRFQRLLPAEALNAATINAAGAIGLASRIGSIEAGKKADLLILKGGDYRHLAYYFGWNPVEAIVKDGRLVDA